MKVFISKDELWPAFYLTEPNNYDQSFEVPEEKIEWIKRIEKEYQETQKYLRKVYGWKE